MNWFPLICLRRIVIFIEKFNQHSLTLEERIRLFEYVAGGQITAKFSLRQFEELAQEDELLTNILATAENSG